MGTAKFEICRPREEWVLQLESRGDLKVEFALSQGTSVFSLKALNYLDKAHPHYGGYLDCVVSPSNASVEVLTPVPWNMTIVVRRLKR